LNVRSAPNSHGGFIVTIPGGSDIQIDCQVGGENINGNTLWYHVPSKGGYVSAAYVNNNGQGAPGCGGGASPFTGRVTTALNVRSAPNSHGGFIVTIPGGSDIQIDCQAAGENVNGNSLWYHVPSRGGYVSAAFVTNGGKTAPACGNIPPPPPTSDCSAGLRNPRTCSEAVAWAEAHLTNQFHSEYRGMCDHFVGLAYGRSASGFDTALIHFNTTPDRFKHYDRNPPPGALVFFRTSAAGHATVSTGGGNVISTDWGCSGCLGRTSISQIESRWGAPYLGWTNPYFHNA